MSTDLSIRTRLNLPYPEALAKTIEAFKKEGFGVLTDIDVQATFKQKLNADFRRYRILGTCNPPLAHRALSASLDVGLLLPCNVVVYEEGETVIVAAIDPLSMLGIIPDNLELAQVAEEARERIQRVMQSLNGG
ncbi:MAG: DUF302 domain-containing protein [Pseudomonadota bacterium]